MKLPKTQQKTPSPEIFRLFKNVSLFPKEIQGFLRKAIRKPFPLAKKTILKQISSPYFPVRFKGNPLRNMQKVQLLSSLQEKQIKELVSIRKIPVESKRIVGMQGEKEEKGTILNNFKKNKLHVNNYKENKAILVKYNENELDLVNSIEKSYISMNFNDNNVILPKINENELNSSNLNENKGFLEEDTLNEATRDEGGLLELESLDNSIGFYKEKGKEEIDYIGKINRILGGSQIKDLTEMWFEGNERESLLENLLKDERESYFHYL